MSQYVDGFVLAVPKSKLPLYRRMARAAGRVWRKHGALDYKECVLDDSKPKFVTFTFPQMAKAKKGEVVFFSYIVYKSRRHRDAVNKKVMAIFESDPKNKEKSMPFDMKRMAYGGFKVFVSA